MYDKVELHPLMISLHVRVHHYFYLDQPFPTASKAGGEKKKKMQRSLKQEDSHPQKESTEV